MSACENICETGCELTCQFSQEQESHDDYLREDLPSSGETKCNHDYKVAGKENGKMILVCSHCADTVKRIPREETESEKPDDKPLLMENVVL